MMLYEIQNNELQVKINTLGAEVQSIFSVKDNLEVLWQADKKHWARHAPVLFPIIGKLRNNALKTNKEIYTMNQHGFARDSDFTLVEKNKHSVTLVLKSTDKTREQFPFDFELFVKYSIQSAKLNCQFTVKNLDQSTLPFSIGGHPAFNWPLLPNVNKKQHRITFNKNESGFISLLKDGLICRDDLPSPVKDKTLDLQESLFINDALIFKNVNSHTLRYEAFENEEILACIEMKYEDFNDVGIWTKPGADFVCLEPWLGYSSAVDFDADFNQKSGLIHLQPNEKQLYSFSIEVKTH